MIERNQQPDPKLVCFTEAAEMRSGGTSSKQKAGRHITKQWEAYSCHGQKPGPPVDAQGVPHISGSPLQGKAPCLEAHRLKPKRKRNKQTQNPSRSLQRAGKKEA